MDRIYSALAIANKHKITLLRDALFSLKKTISVLRTEYKIVEVDEKMNQKIQNNVIWKKI